MANVQIKKDLFENEPVPKALASLAIPTIISQLITLIYNVADTLFVGQTGDPYKIAAVSLAFTMFVMTVPIANLFGIGGGGLIARLLGINELKRSKAVSAFSFYASAAFGLLFSLIVLTFLDPLLYTLGASEHTIKFARQYMLMVVIIGAVPTILSNTMAHLLRNAGYSSKASIGLSGGGILNIILDPLFMFVVFPDGMEVFGAALATLLSNIASMIYFLLVMSKVQKETALSISPSDVKSINREDIKAVFSVGLPAAVLPALYDLTNIFLNSHMAAHGDMQLAAIGVVLKVERLPNAIGIGISQGMLPLVGYNYSSGNHKRMKSVIGFSRFAGIVVNILTVMFYELFAGVLAALFISTSGNADAVLALDYATSFLRIRALMAPFMYLNYHSSYCFQAMGDGRDTLVHSVVRQLVCNLPLLFLFDVWMGEIGLALSIVVGEMLSAAFAVFLLIRWLKKVEKDKGLSYN